MWTALDIFIGLALCYALISLFCTAIQEFIAQIFDWRGKLLVRALYSVDFEKLVEKLGTNFLANPGNLGSWRSGTSQKTSLEPKSLEPQKDTSGSPATDSDQSKPPILIQSRRLMADPTPENLAKTISSGMGLIANGASELKSDGAINNLKVPDGLKARLLALSDDARKDVDKVKAEVEKWCGDFLAEVNHWFTRRAQVVSLMIGFAVALALNVDTIEIATKLKNDPVAREAAVKTAEKLVADGKLKDCPRPNDPAAKSDADAKKKGASHKDTEVKEPPKDTSKGTETKEQPKDAPKGTEATTANGSVVTTAGADKNNDASKKVATKAPEDAQTTVSDIKNCLASIKTTYPIPLGWDGVAAVKKELESKDGWAMAKPLKVFCAIIGAIDLIKLIGLLLTAIALSLGSRFWFDTLKNLLALRTGGQPKAKAT